MAALEEVKQQLKEDSRGSRRKATWTIERCRGRRRQTTRQLNDSSMNTVHGDNNHYGVTWTVASGCSDGVTWAQGWGTGLGKQLHPWKSHAEPYPGGSGLPAILEDLLSPTTAVCANSVAKKEVSGNIREGRRLHQMPLLLSRTSWQVKRLGICPEKNPCPARIAWTCPVSAWLFP